MAQSNDNDVENILRLFLLGRERPVKRKDCPDEEVLVDLLAGSLTEPGRLRVQKHLETCGACVDELASFRESVRDNAEGEVLPALIARVKGFVSEIDSQQPFFDISVRLADMAIELVTTTGHRVDRAAPVAMRGSAGARSGLEIATEMGNFSVSVNVEYVQPDACDVVVGVRDHPGGEPVEGMRVGLCSYDRERASYLTKQQGTVAFDGVGHGKYTLPIRDDSGLVGTVRLDIA